MKILMIATDNSYTSGAFRSMAFLCKELTNEFKHEVLVVLPKPGDGENLLRELNIDFLTIRSYSWIVPRNTKGIRASIIEIGKIIYNFIPTIKIKNIIKNHNIDIVHVNTSWGYVGAVAAIRAKVPLVWHIREFLEEDQNSEIFIKNKGYRLLNCSSEIITISDSLKTKYSQILHRENIKTIYNGLDVETYYIKDHRIFDKKQIICTIVGKIRPEKGQEKLIHAFSYIKSQMDRQMYGNIHLNIIGSGDPSYVNKLIDEVRSLGLDEMISFLGRKDDPTEFYKDTDIAFVSSTHEAFGRVTVEAMLAGALVIGCNSAGTRELIQHNKTGMLYEDGDCENIARVVSDVLLRKDEMRIIARKGQEYMKNNMTSYINAHKIDTVYKGLFDLG